MCRLDVARASGVELTCSVFMPCAAATPAMVDSTTSLAPLKTTSRGVRRLGRHAKPLSARIVSFALYSPAHVSFRRKGIWTPSRLELRLL